MSDSELGGKERVECTNMECSGDAEFGYWMPGLGHFSEVRSPEHDQLEDGDLAPYVCESCRDRMAAGPHWNADRFVNPREKLFADGGVKQATLDGHQRERPTCQPPQHPGRTCQNHVERVITVYYAGPAMTEIDWWVCEDHADEVRETGEVRGDRVYSELRDGYGVLDR